MVSAAMLLFLVMDPLGNIPFFITALKHVEPARQRTVVGRELAIALVAMVFFLFVGRYILQLLSISEPALTLAGGVILFLIAVRMIFPSAEKTMQEEVYGEPFVVPLAIPYVAGPSTLATELLLMSREPDRWAEWLLAIFLAWFACSVIIYFASGLRQHLGQKGLIAVERLMGDGADHGGHPDAHDRSSGYAGDVQIVKKTRWALQRNSPAAGLRPRSNY
jgi:multiple antibiotic resistance protein